MRDKIVKVKESDLKALIEANTDAYNILEGISDYPDELKTAINRAFSLLEEAPSEISDIVIEEEEDEAEEENEK